MRVKGADPVVACVHCRSEYTATLPARSHCYGFARDYRRMKRRSFITKALAGLAAIPLLSKLADVFHQRQTYEQVIESQDPSAYWPMSEEAPEMIGHIAYDIDPDGDASVICIYVDGRYVGPSEYTLHNGQIHVNTTTPTGSGDFSRRLINLFRTRYDDAN